MTRMLRVCCIRCFERCRRLCVWREGVVVVDNCSLINGRLVVCIYVYCCSVFVCECDGKLKKLLWMHFQ